MNFSGDSADSMYDSTQAIIADYLLALSRSAARHSRSQGRVGSRRRWHAAGVAVRRSLMIRFSIASNGHDWILTDNETGELRDAHGAAHAQDIVDRMGVTSTGIDWEGAFSRQLPRRSGHSEEDRPYQEMAIAKSLWRVRPGRDRVLLLMATGTGKTFTVFQLVWKLMNGDVLKRNRVLFLTDRNSLKDQAYRAFAAFAARTSASSSTRTPSPAAEHLVGKMFFANYQNLDEELDGKKVYEHFDPDFFDLVVVDECHRSGFGDWFGVLEHFGRPIQLGLTATPRELEERGVRSPTRSSAETPTTTSASRSTPTPCKQAIEDGYLVPYLLEERITNVDEDGYTGPDGKHYTTKNFERDIRLPDRTTLIAEDLWAHLRQVRSARREDHHLLRRRHPCGLHGRGAASTVRRPRLRRAHHPLRAQLATSSSGTSPRSAAPNRASPSRSIC